MLVEVALKKGSPPGRETESQTDREALVSAAESDEMPID